MSRITVTRRWPDGETIQVSVRVEDMYPEELTTARLNCLEAFSEAVADALGVPMEAIEANLEDES